METVPLRNGREVSVVVTGRTSLVRAMREIESEGFEVIDVLPRLRALIIYLTPEQISDMSEIDGDSWTTTVMDKWKGNLFN